ncbi:hypothetical protein PRIPAC_84161 [Pristionchus pacificus]|uniref:ADP-ribosylation factor-related protein 1 n=1 Tax=Pristionchus pacificus TaxID=54126 RepID=A0A2A6BGS5_PRIPA|nr:hypothetical protein PRIPAC_84161 [Pristionchus pacificus]|eukprot:PDM65058.1 ADP ribosylation factor [Pristionchus pacificus]
MYTLSVGLWEQFFQKKDYFVVIVGLDNAGKTTFLEQIKGKFVKNYPMLNPAKITSTVGLNIGKVEVDQARLNFWDVGGQEDLRCLWANYLDEASALIYVVDASRPDLLPTVAESFKEVMKVERVKEVPILVAVNKSELEGAITADKVRMALDDGDHEADMAVLPVSALEGLNVDRCVRWILRSLASKPLFLD